MREYKDAMEYIEEIENQVRSLKMQREEKAHEEKIHELNGGEAARRKISKADQAFEDRKRQQAREIGLV